MTDLVEVGRYPSQKAAEQGALVLAAVGISCRVEPFGSVMALMVTARHAERARRELAHYAYENQLALSDRTPPPRIDRWSIESALAYIALLVFFFVADTRSLGGHAWQIQGAADAGLIMDGTWWRTVTALTLHTGSVHLFGNIAAGTIFGILLSHRLGGGVAWLAIVSAGALGNALNAAFQPDAHLSIGASTAVFGGLGLLAGMAMTSPRALQWRGTLRRWAPIGAGLMLLAFFGMGGERTDIWAHVFGFVVGAVAGFALAHIDPAPLRQRTVQAWSAAAAFGLVAVAWLIALSG